MAKKSKKSKKQITKNLKKYIGISFIILGFLGAVSSYYFRISPSDSRAYSDVAGKTWKLFYSDEFNGSALDTSRWSAYHNTYGDGNNEEACLTPNNVAVSGGSLKITAKHENVACPSKPVDNFTSGFIGSREAGDYYPAFARYEIKAKLPHGQGLWPAFWLRHVNGASTAEVDILEYFHAQVPGKTTQTLHFPAEIGSNVSKKTTSFETATSSPGWHTWAVEILPIDSSGTSAKFVFYQDEVKTFEYIPTKFGWLNNYNKNSMFDMAINLAVGGTYNGHPDDDLGWSRYLNKCLKPYGGSQPCSSSGILRANFPMNYEIDYVRVYSLEDIPAPEPEPEPDPTPTPTTGGGSSTGSSSTSSNKTTTDSISSSGSTPTSSTSPKEDPEVTDPAVTPKKSLSPEIFSDPEEVKKIKKVEYLVDGKVVQSYDKPPFDLDLTKLPNGNVKVTERITYVNGKSTTKDHELIIGSESAEKSQTGLSKNLRLSGGILIIATLILAIIYKLPFLLKDLNSGLGKLKK